MNVGLTLLVLVMTTLCARCPVTAAAGWFWPRCWAVPFRRMWLLPTLPVPAVSGRLPGRGT